MKTQQDYLDWLDRGWFEPGLGLSAAGLDAALASGQSVSDLVNPVSGLLIDDVAPSALRRLGELHPGIVTEGPSLGTAIALYPAGDVNLGYSTLPGSFHVAELHAAGGAAASPVDQQAPAGNGAQNAPTSSAGLGLALAAGLAALALSRRR